MGAQAQTGVGLLMHFSRRRRLNDIHGRMSDNSRQDFFNEVMRIPGARA